MPDRPSGRFGVGAGLGAGPFSFVPLPQATQIPDAVVPVATFPILVVEHKGEDRWSTDDSKEKRAVGNLWADRSKGKCLFVMPKGPDWKAITEAIGR